MSRSVFRSAVLAALSLVLAGCSAQVATPATPSTAAGFHLPDDFQPNTAAQSCLLHQDADPTSAYLGGASASPALQLPFMAYLHANGNKAFCDGKAATAVDKKWAAAYVTLTGDAADVAALAR